MMHEKLALEDVKKNAEAIKKIERNIRYFFEMHDENGDGSCTLREFLVGMKHRSFTFPEGHDEL